MDFTEGVRVFFSLLAVLGLIGIVSMGLRKFSLTAAGSALTRERRLQVVETLAVDQRRRVVILKCDGAEHLLLLGPASECVIADLPERQTDRSTAKFAAPLKKTFLATHRNAA